jgi:hypothetical protein
MESLLRIDVTYSSVIGFETHAFRQDTANAVSGGNNTGVEGKADDVSDVTRGIYFILSIQPCRE